MNRLSNNILCITLIKHFGFLFSIVVASGGEEGGGSEGGRQSMPLAQSLLNAVADLLFCPEFTVSPNKKSNRDEVDDLQVHDNFKRVVQ